MKHLKDHIRELKINSKGFPYSEIDEISLEYSKNNLLLSEELQNIYLNQLEIYNNSCENELNLGINKILQTYSIDLQCVWEYLSSCPDNDILNESINDSIEKYVSDSESSDNENIRSKPKLEFGNYLKHCTFTNNSVDYYVPAVGMYNISIMPHEKDIINQALEFGDIFPDNYDSEKQIWVHESNSKPIEIEGNGFELCFDVYKIDKQVSNKINKSKKRDHKQFKKACEKSLEIIHSSLYSSSNNEFVRNISQHLERQSFESYIWSSFDKNKVLLESFYSDAPTEFPVFPSSLKLISDGNPFTILSQVAEVLFGSCPKFLESKSDLNKNIKKILAEIKRRHNSIVYFCNNSILSKKISKKLCDQIIEPLIYEMSHTLLNSRKESVAGFQYKFQLAKQVIIDFPFEATIVTNSSMGRLYIIENYNRLTSHPDFIKSKTASHIFGFSLSSNDEVSRFLNIQKDFRNRGSEERRLRIMHRIRANIRRLANLLKPVVQWRILIERDVRKLQEAKYKCDRNASFKEDLIFGIFSISLYYLSLLKHLNLNVDRTFRIKIECNRHPESHLNNEFDKSCVCKYGMDAKFISKALQKKESRSGQIEKNINIYFDFSKEKNCYIPKPETIAKNSKIIDFLESQNDIKKCFEKSLKKSIII